MKLIDKKTIESLTFECGRCGSGEALGVSVYPYHAPRPYAEIYAKCWKCDPRRSQMATIGGDEADSLLAAKKPFVFFRPEARGK